MTNNLTIYVPVAIVERARSLNVKLSQVCKAAILAEIDRIEREQISGVIKKIDFHRVDEDCTPEKDWMERRSTGEG